MNPGPTLGGWAVFAAYAVVLGSLLIFIQFMASKRRRLERRLIDLQQLDK